MDSSPASRYNLPTSPGNCVPAFHHQEQHHHHEFEGFFYRLSMKNKLWVILGTFFVGLALLGVFLPILPTTPFLLLAAVFYGRGSPRFYDWLVNRSFLGDYIRNYRDGLGIPLRQKILTIALLWLTIGISLWFANAWWLRLLLLVIASGVTFHLVKIKTRQRARPAPPIPVEPEDLLDLP